MRLPGSKGKPQWLAWTEQMGLPYDFIKVARAELLCERGIWLPFREEVIH